VKVFEENIPGCFSI